MGLDNPLHIAILVVVLLLVFGARRLPSLGRSIGTGMREFKEGITGSPEPPAGIESAQPAVLAQPEVMPASAPAGEDTQATTTV
jgi:sec-independent protein translocase protein TatA